MQTFSNALASFPSPLAQNVTLDNEHRYALKTIRLFARNYLPPFDPEKPIEPLLTKRTPKMSEIL